MNADQELSGFGIGLRSPHFAELERNLPTQVDWFEITSENFMGFQGWSRKVLERVREERPVAMHGVSLSIGSEAPLDLRYLKRLKRLKDELQPALVSDHLSWTRLPGYPSSFDLLPLRYDLRSFELVREKVAAIQDYLNAPIALENPSMYVAFEAHDFDEAEFLAELSRRTGCLILLDLNNLNVNRINLGIDPLRYLQQLKPRGEPGGSVAYFHLAGYDGSQPIAIDTHGEAVSDSTWELYRLFSKAWPQVPTLIERDENIPPLAELCREVDKARRLAAKLEFRSPEIKFEPESLKRASLKPAAIKSDSESRCFQEDFLQALQSRNALPQRDARTFAAQNVGFQVYRKGYRARLRDLILSATPLASESIGIDAAREQIDAFIESLNADLRDSPQSIDEMVGLYVRYLFRTQEPAAIAIAHRELARFEFLVMLLPKRFPWKLDAEDPLLSLEELSSLAPDELAGLKLSRNPKLRCLRFAFPVHTFHADPKSRATLLADLSSGRLQTVQLLMLVSEGKIKIKAINESSSTIIHSLRDRDSLLEVYERLCRKSPDFCVQTYFTLIADLAAFGSFLKAF